MEWDPFSLSPASGRGLDDFARFEGGLSGIGGAEGGGGRGESLSSDPPDASTYDSSTKADGGRRRGGNVDDPLRGRADPAGRHALDDDCSELRYASPGVSPGDGFEDDSALGGAQRSEASWGSWNVLPDAGAPRERTGSEGSDVSALRTYHDSRRVRRKGEQQQQQQRRQRQERRVFRQAAPGQSQGAGLLERRLLSLVSQSSSSPRRSPQDNDNNPPRPAPSRAHTARPYDESSAPSFLTDERNEDANRRGE